MYYLLLQNFLYLNQIFYYIYDWNRFHSKVFHYYESDSNHKYVGDWKNDVKDGKGIYYYYSSGNRYEGEFKDDHGEGKGIFYYQNGDKHEGVFHNGKPIGVHTKYYANGNVEKIDSSYFKA